MKFPVSNLDSFIVVNKTNLNDQNHRVLVNLYQPIIGALAVSVYLSLWRYTDNVMSKTFIHSDLVNFMQIRLEEIVNSREKLEAIGLLKTYLKKGDNNNYIYELYNPLNEYEFINNPLLNTALFNNVSKKEYKRIISDLIVPSFEIKGYEDVSANFNSVFSFRKSKNLDTPNVRSISNLDLSFEPTISLNEILNFIPNEVLNYKSITKNIRDIIYKLSYVYNLNNENMKDILYESVRDNKIDVSLLKENCRNFYKFENNGKIPKVVFQNQPENLRMSNLDDSKMSRLVSQFEAINPFEFLSRKQGNSKPIKKDLELLEYLLVELELLPGVVNVLIDYVLKINNNKLTKNFVEQIASQWKRSGINTVIDALEIAKKEFSKRTRPTVKVKKESITPNWMENVIDSELATEDEIKEFERRLSN